MFRLFCTFYVISEMENKREKAEIRRIWDRNHEKGHSSNNFPIIGFRTFLNLEFDYIPTYNM